MLLTAVLPWTCFLGPLSRPCCSYGEDSLDVTKVRALTSFDFIASNYKALVQRYALDLSEAFPEKKVEAQGVFATPATSHCLPTAAKESHQAADQGNCGPCQQRSHLGTPEARHVRTGEDAVADVIAGKERLWLIS